jgi:hypothetical protein
LEAISQQAAGLSAQVSATTANLLLDLEPLGKLPLVGREADQEVDMLLCKDNTKHLQAMHPRISYLSEKHQNPPSTQLDLPSNHGICTPF